MKVEIRMQPFSKLRAALFPPVDPIDSQLEQLSKQGSGMARAAHFFATLLVVLFSAGSLVALGSDALRSVLYSWQLYHVVDIPSAISLCVSTLMVLAMDIAMLSAASTLRLLASRRSHWRERALHVLVMGVVAVLEAGTYGYMSWTFEHPATMAAGALIAARAIAAPLLAVYLSMSRPLPVSSKDILALAETAAGAGVLRDVTSAARNPEASLDRKMKLYSSAAVMTPHDRQRLDSMIEAVQSDDGSPRLPAPDGPTGTTRGRERALVSVTEDMGAVPASTRVKPLRARRNALNYEKQARAAFEQGATSVAKLQRATGMSKAAAAGWARALKAERSGRNEVSA
jgi:hypothetical protein